MDASVLARLVPGMNSGTAVLHIAVGLLRPNPVGSVGSDPGRDSILWNVVAGLGLLVLGEKARRTARETGRLPAPPALDQPSG